MHRVVFAAAGLFLLTCAASGQTPAPPGMAGSAALPPGEGRDVTMRVCGKCHDAGIFANQSLDAEGWKETVNQMASSGAEGTDADFAAIAAYLTKAFPAK
jgi:mono/diheme cytochrome c family protein